MDSIPLGTQETHHKFLESMQHALKMANSYIFRANMKGLGQTHFHCYFRTVAMLSLPVLWNVRGLKQHVDHTHLHLILKNQLGKISIPVIAPRRTGIPLYKQQSQRSVLVSLLTTGKHVLSISQFQGEFRRREDKKNRHAMLPTPLLTIACKFGGKTGESALTERFLCK